MYETIEDFLINLPRSVIEYYFFTKQVLIYDDLETIHGIEEKYGHTKGLYVSIFNKFRTDSYLRGRYGTFDRTESIVDTISNATINAAFHDPDFPRLKVYELKESKMQLDMLFNIEEYIGLLDKKYCKKLAKEAKGIMLESGGRRAVLLPYEWDNVTSHLKVLTMLSLAVGLPADGYSYISTQVFTFDAITFKES